MKKWIYILLVLCAKYSFAQVEISYLNYDPFFEDSAIISHSVVKPIAVKKIESTGWNLRKEEKANYLRIYPATSILGGVLENSGDITSSYRLAGGFGIESKIGKKIHLRGNIVSGYYKNENGSLKNSVIPNSYLYQETETGKLEIQPRFLLSYTPNKHFNFRTGIDQHFVGEGKRSVLLSDYSAPHPFFQLRTSIWRIEFINLYQFFRENVATQSRNKFASTHMLNFQASKRFQIGFFESVVFSPKDTLLNRGYELEYLNPFLFYRPTEYSIGSQDRLLIGLNLSYQFDKIMLYGQFALDEFVLSEIVGRTRWWANKYSGQIGFKGKAILNQTKLRYLSEVNFIRPFTYTHLNESTNYGHQGISLAHPLGANLVESFTELSLHFKKNRVLKTQIMFVQQGGQDSDSEVTYGQDVYASYTDRPFEYGYYIGANGRSNRLRISLEFMAPLYQKIKLNAFIRPGIELMQINTGSYNQLPFLYCGIRTNLWNDRSFTF